MLEVINVSKSYGSKRVLTDVNIRVKAGESTAIIGESGSGKTTLAKIIIGIEKQDAGRVLLDDEELGVLKRRNFKNCSKIQYIFQDPYGALENNYSLKQTLDETIKICKRNKYKCMDIVEVLSYVDENLLEYLNKDISMLSGGQRQKLCIARALIMKPKIIIADECTSMLDKKSSLEILKLLDRIKLEQGVSIISILHEIDFINDTWDNVAVFRDGQIIEYGKFKGFYDNCSQEYSKKLVDAFYYFKKEEKYNG
ncbi:MAG TPA: hypothetical protein DC000_01080 [Clostridiales bacterium]|nr:hypothetical protein [Clostridiales bacterium]